MGKSRAKKAAKPKIKTIPLKAGEAAKIVAAPGTVPLVVAGPAANVAAVIAVKPEELKKEPHGWLWNALFG